MSLASFIYIGVTLLRFSEVEVWRMTPFKLMELYRVYKEFHGIKTKSNDGEVDIDDILRGL